MQCQQTVWLVLLVPVQELSACHKLSDKVHLTRRDVDSIQADAVWMLHLHKAVVSHRVVYAGTIAAHGPAELMLFKPKQMQGV